MQGPQTRRMQPLGLGVAEHHPCLPTIQRAVWMRNCHEQHLARSVWPSVHKVGDEPIHLTSCRGTHVGPEAFNRQAHTLHYSMA